MRNIHFIPRPELARVCPTSVAGCFVVGQRMSRRGPIQSTEGAGMRVVCGVVLKCLTCFLAALLLFAATAAAEGATALGGTGQSPLESPLVVPEAQSLLGGQGTTEAEEVRRNSPEAVLAREESQTKYEGLSAEEAVKLAGEVFPEVMDRPAGGLPQLPAGQTITGYPEDDAAQVDFGEGKRGVIESTEPIAVEGSSGQRVPVDLGLVEAGGGFQPVTPVVGVLIPKRLSEGVGIPGIGVSLTPVDGSARRWVARREQ